LDEDESCITYYKSKPSSKNKDDGKLGMLFLNSTNTIVEICHGSPIPDDDDKNYDTVVSPQLYDVKVKKEEQQFMLNSNVVQCIYKERFNRQRKERGNSVVFARKSRNYNTKVDVSQVFGSDLPELTPEEPKASPSKKKDRAKCFKFAITVGQSNSGSSNGKIFKDRRYKLYCETEEERDRWVKAITRCIENQVKVLIKKPYTFDNVRDYERFMEFVSMASQEQVIHTLNNIRMPIQEPFVISWMVLMDFFSYQKVCRGLLLHG